MQPKEHIALIMEQLHKTLLLRAKHCYTRQLVSPAKRCDFCKKSMFVMTLRCKDCRVRCHRRCAQQAAKLCELAAKHTFIATGPESRNSVPTCHAALEATRRHQSVNSTPLQSNRRKSSTDSFREIESHQSTFSVRRSTARQRLSTTDSVHKEYSLGHVSRSTLSSHSSNRSSVSGYYSLESDVGLLSECDTPKEISVFDSLGPDEVTLPNPSLISRARRHEAWVSTKPSPGSTSMDCPAHGNCESGFETNTIVSQGGGSLVATWPLDRKCILCSHIPENNCNSNDEIVSDESCSLHYEARKEGLSEWTIPHDNLKYGRCIERGKLGSTFKGHWHGEVLIQTRNSNSTDINDFLDEVDVLSKIRHENIALFMGACVEPGHLAVVNSIHKGPSLYHHLHVQRRKISFNIPKIARQIGQAMGYLHAKGIIVGHLSSRCVYLESKVKLSITRVDTSDVTCQRSNHACLPRGKLNYLAPELLGTARVIPPELITRTEQTHSTDVYAFGTILFEIIAGRWPLQYACSESVIYQICSGKRDDFRKVSCSSSIKNLIQECWSHDPCERPSFQHIVKELKKNVSLGNMKHSLSEPDNLNRLGTGLFR
ncbi:spindle assembly checkpoint kinase-like [Lytechinus variegatus]|uniref:spindle assembly checkpoint kinase-like n=1 Tax=Lytechinus variegatus TaxID=7654 RepID=UPI001BB21101|nr:spindle assembly checkpoint kinase-like [Lytechinus variegatus]